MDSLYHFIFALVGGYVFVKAARAEYRFRVLFGLSFAAVLIDFDHVFGSLNNHNVFVLVPSILAFLYATFRKRKNLKLYSLLLTVMLYGHLLSDLTYGQGIPLFFPLSSVRYRIPWQFMDPNFVSAFGLILFFYFAVIALSALYYRKRGF